MDRKKEQQRDELHRGIWGIANDLRGSVDGWDFKSYVLGTMFYRYISENLTDYINKGEEEAKVENFDYAKLSDEDAMMAKDGLVEEKGFFILPSQLFCNMIKYIKENRDEALENLNVVLKNTFIAIENSALGTSSESDFKGLFDDFDCNSNKLVFTN